MRSEFGFHSTVSSRFVSGQRFHSSELCPKLGSRAAALLGLVLGGGGAAHAGIIAFSSSAPTFLGTDTVISAPVKAAGANGKYDGDNNYHGAGQSFTTGSNSTGYLLKSFTYQISASNAPTGTFDFEVISLASPTTTVSTNTSLASPEGSYTVVALDTAAVSGSGNFPASDYVTFAFSTPVSLSASTTYAFDVFGPTYFNLDEANGESTPVNTNVSEIAINEYSAYGASVGSTGSYIVSGYITNYCLIPTIIIGNKAVCPIIGEEYGSLERAVHYVIYDQGGST